MIQIARFDERVEAGPSVRAPELAAVFSSGFVSAGRPIPPRRCQSATPAAPPRHSSAAGRGRQNSFVRAAVSPHRCRTGMLHLPAAGFFPRQTCCSSWPNSVSRCRVSRRRCHADRSPRGKNRPQPAGLGLQSFFQLLPPPFTPLDFGGQFQFAQGARAIVFRVPQVPLGSGFSLLGGGTDLIPIMVRMSRCVRQKGSTIRLLSTPRRPML